MLTHLTTLNPVDSAVFWTQKTCRRGQGTEQVHLTEAISKENPGLLFFFNLICESSTVALLELFTSLLPLFTASQVTEMGQQRWNLTGIVSWGLRHHGRFLGC